MKRNSQYMKLQLCAPKSFSNPTSHLQMTGVELWTLILHCLSNSVHIFSNVLIYFFYCCCCCNIEDGFILFFLLCLFFLFSSIFLIYFSFFFFTTSRSSLCPFFLHLLSLFFTHYTATFLRLHHFLLPAHPKHLHPNDPVHQNMRLE